MQVTFMPYDDSKSHISKTALKAQDNHRLIYQYTGIAADEAGIHEAVVLRIYHSKPYATTQNAIIWIHDPKDWRSASGSANGFGYHLPSAAAQDAIDNAGIHLSESIDGRGDELISEALEAITRTKYPNASFVKVIKAHN